MLLVRPIHDPDFLSRYSLGVETHITRDDVLDGYDRYIPFVHGVHLPYKGVNFASLDETERQKGLELVKRAADVAVRYPVDRVVMHPCGIMSINGEKCGEYGKLIDSLGEIADYLAQKGLIVCLENQLYKPADVREVFACRSSEWFQLYTDLNRSNVKLTFDSSHAASCAAEESTDEKRIAALWKYLEHPDYIGRFHWSDSRISGGESLFRDMHLVPGQGDLPREFHQAIWRHPARKLLEQRCTKEEVASGLVFISGL
ncbi:MAG: sugar phosphate isomerase/epimerase [Lentisphaerae bacterium]|nr:sugar phosphate isomerase/epimerase [Lentisphaerota bacterium]